MTQIGAYEAKTHFAALLDRVQNGERIAITRHGRVVAVLTPAPDAPQHTVDEAIAEILKSRKGRKLGKGVSVRDLINAGRK